MTASNFKINNPGAAVMIFNYKYRLGTINISEEQAHEVEQIVLNTVSLKSVSVSKSKSQPSGSFEFELAPTKNWVNTITPGSWCVILMSQNPIRPEDTKYRNPRVSRDKFKMLGRIESVRVDSSVRQGDGAVITRYIVQGEDWGDLFNTNLYVDPLIRSTADANDPIGTAARMLYNKALTGYKDSEGNTTLPSSRENLTTLLKFFGADTNKTRLNIQRESQNIGRISSSRNLIRLPKDVAKYMGFTDAKENLSPVIADIIELVTGRLKTKDKVLLSADDAYDKVNDGSSVIPLDSVLGTNSFWQLIINNSNHWINETFSELRWIEKDGIEVPQLCLYNRIKPFCLRKSTEIKDNSNAKLSEDLKGTFVASPQEKTLEAVNNNSKIEEFVSLFKDIKTYNIDEEDVIAINAGTNWRDRYNFIEVNVTYGNLGGVRENQNWTAEQKRINQSADTVAIGRDGFKPLIVNTSFIPPSTSGKGLDILRIADYKLINKEWYFNTHRMLNGSVVLVGQSDYVSVGDNIMMPARVLFRGNNGNIDNITAQNDAFFLAHIESVSHTCNVSEEGARNFVTNISFVRGIIVDKDGKQIQDTMLLDQDTSSVSPTQELNTKVFGVSTNNDPDSQRLINKETNKVNKVNKTKK